MRIHVISDIHGNMSALGRAGDGADLVIALGDFLDYIDYYDSSGGVLGEVFGPDKVAKFIALRTAGAFNEMHEYDRELWSEIADPVGTITEIVATRYEQVIRLLGDRAMVTLGNVDMREIWAAVAPEPLRCLDGETVMIDGRKFGFVAGGSNKEVPTHSPWRPFVRTPTAYRDAVERVGPVDVLCSHVPPKIDALRFDTVPKRFEMYGPGLLESIELHKPAMSLFGHIHQPESGRLWYGRTRCINVGHFQRTEAPYVLDTNTLPSPTD
ncbi:metallophosphoesterase family protein [Streptomyces sp. 1222.5]|uniref:metallophosphoesterase family protein n=1 Tax=Streptomyces sp. 1222.5 TaxID=1881026 RepID=UPI003D702897